MAGALVIDDSLALASSVSKALQQAGYDPVHMATDWAGCRSALARYVPELVVLDVEMAGMVNGDVMAMQLRRNPRCSSARFVLYSGLSERDLQVLAKRCAADAYLKKGDEAALVDLCLKLVPLK